MLNQLTEQTSVSHWIMLKRTTQRDAGHQVLLGRERRMLLDPPYHHSPGRTVSRTWPRLSAMSGDPLVVNDDSTWQFFEICIGLYPHFLLLRCQSPCLFLIVLSWLGEVTPPPRWLLAVARSRHSSGWFVIGEVVVSGWHGRGSCCRCLSPLRGCDPSPTYR